MNHSMLDKISKENQKIEVETRKYKSRKHMICRDEPIIWLLKNESETNRYPTFTLKDLFSDFFGKFSTFAIANITRWRTDEP